MRVVSVCLLAVACNIEFPDERDCATRSAWYQDADGDGLAEPETVVIRCDSPGSTWVEYTEDLRFESSDTPGTTTTPPGGTGGTSTPTGGTGGSSTPTGGTGTFPMSTGETGVTATGTGLQGGTGSVGGTGGAGGTGSVGGTGTP